MNYTYPIHSYRVIDGDTIQVSLDLGFKLSLDLSCRVYGVDTPEIKTEAGKYVREQITEWMDNHKSRLFCVSIAMDKYAGRFVGDFVSGDQYLSKWLIDCGYAKEYFGGRKSVWSDEELGKIIST